MLGCIFPTCFVLVGSSSGSSKVNGTRLVGKRDLCCIRLMQSAAGKLYCS